jgi:hypothetical protein
MLLIITHKILNLPPHTEEAVLKLLLPTYLPTCLPAYLFTYLSTYLPDKLFTIPEVRVQGQRTQHMVTTHLLTSLFYNCLSGDHP